MCAGAALTPENIRKRVESTRRAMRRAEAAAAKAAAVAPEAAPGLEDSADAARAIRAAVASSEAGAKLVETDLAQLRERAEAALAEAYDAEKLGRSADALDDLEPVDPDGWLSVLRDTRERLLTARLARGFVTTTEDLNDEIDQILSVVLRHDPTFARMLAGRDRDNDQPASAWTLVALATFAYDSPARQAWRNEVRARYAGTSPRARVRDAGLALTAATAAARDELNRLMSVCGALGVPSLAKLDSAMQRRARLAHNAQVVRDPAGLSTLRQSGPVRPVGVDAGVLAARRVARERAAAHSVRRAG